MKRSVWAKEIEAPALSEIELPDFGQDRVKKDDDQAAELPTNTSVCIDPMASKKANYIKVEIPHFVPKELRVVYKGAARLAAFRGVALNRKGEVNYKALKKAYVELLTSYKDLKEDVK